MIVAKESNVDCTVKADSCGQSRRPKEPRQPVKRAPPDPEASSERTDPPGVAQPSKRGRPNSASESLPEACRARRSGSEANTGSHRGTPEEHSPDEGSVDAVPGTSSEGMAAAGGNVDEQFVSLRLSQAQEAIILALTLPIDAACQL